MSRGAGVVTGNQSPYQSRDVSRLERLRDVRLIAGSLR